MWVSGYIFMNVPVSAHLCLSPSSPCLGLGLGPLEKLCSTRQMERCPVLEVESTNERSHSQQEASGPRARVGREQQDAAGQRSAVIRDASVR